MDDGKKNGRFELIRFAVNMTKPADQVHRALFSNVICAKIHHSSELANFRRRFHSNFEIGGDLEDLEEGFEIGGGLEDLEDLEESGNPVSLR